MNSDMFTIILHTPTDRGLGLTALFTGPPGIGKTSRIEQEGACRDLPVLTLSPAAMGDAFFGAVPVPAVQKDGTMVLRLPVPDSVQALIDAGKGIIFIDELRAAPPHLRATLLGIFQERRYGTRQLPRAIRIMGASNSVHDSINGRPLAAPESNRFCHLRSDPPKPTDVALWATRRNQETARFDADRIDRVLEASHSKTLPKYMAMMAAYGTKNPAHFMENVKSGTPQADGAWASPRSWTNAMAACATWDVLVSEELIEPTIDENGQKAKTIWEDNNIRSIVQGCVGEAAALGFFTFMKEADLPDPYDWLSGKIQLNYDEKRPDIGYVIYGTAATIICGTVDASTRVKYIDKFFEIAVDRYNKGKLRLEEIQDAVAILHEQAPRAEVVGTENSRKYSNICAQIARKMKK